MARSKIDVQADLTAARADHERHMNAAADAIAYIEGLANAVIKQGACRANQLLNRFEVESLEDGDPSAFDWSHPAWTEFRPLHDDQLPAIVRVGKINEKPMLPGEAGADLPFGVSIFQGSGPVVIKHDESSKGDARHTLQSLLLRLAILTPGHVKFTLLDPSGVGSAFPFRGFLGRDLVRAPRRTAADELFEVLDDIRRINDRVLGAAPRFSALTPKQRSGESFEVIAVADFPRAYSKDSRAVEAIFKIANAGAQAGRHLIIEWDDDGKLPHDIHFEDIDSPTVIDLGGRGFTADVPPERGRQELLINQAFEGARRGEADDWNAIVRPATFMSETSIDRVSTPIGERLRFWLGESEEGKTSAHAMVAGQTGSGKSYLLHVLITGLAARYSPDELRLTLIDGKQGVEFEAYRHLPHVEVVSLRSAPALARSVLEDFLFEMEDRYEKFQAIGVVKLADFRRNSGKHMPRCVLVVDEYQQLLEGDPESGSRSLSKLLEKGRAAGMHVVLGSQTFEQRGLGQAALTHIHTWASLSVSETYAQSMQVFGAEGKRLIRELANSGEVVLNDDGGRDGANHRGAVARLRTADGEDLLSGIVSEIQEHSTTDRKPVVLSGRDGALVSDNEHLVTPRDVPMTPEQLQVIARRDVREGGFGIESWNKADKPIPLWLGRRFDVRGHAICPIRRAPYQNVLILGSDAEARHRMLASGLVGLGALLPPNMYQVYLIDGLREDMPGGGMLRAALDLLRASGVQVHIFGPEEVGEALADLAATTDSVDPLSPSRLVVVSEPDYIYTLHGAADRFSIPESGPCFHLREILRKGPQAGVHTILTASGLPSFQLVLSASRESIMFNHRVVQQMNEDDSMSLFSSLVAARIDERADHPLACLSVDNMSGVRCATLFHSYTAARSLADDQGLDALKTELSKVPMLRGDHVA